MFVPTVDINHLNGLENVQTVIDGIPWKRQRY